MRTVRWALEIALICTLHVVTAKRDMARRGTAEGHLKSSSDSIARVSQQDVFNELVFGAEHLYQDFKNEQAAVNQARTAFLLCSACPYTGPALSFFGEMYGIDHLVDRKYIVDKIFPALKLVTSSPSYLSVGVKPYTTRYEYILRNDGAVRFDTIELDASQAIYGSSQNHITDKAQNIDKHVSVATYDVIIANGVLGWGIDSPAEISEFYFTQARVLKPNGYLIIGYNPHIGSNHTAGIEEHFKKISLGGLPQTVSFDIEWKHNYEFYQKL